MLSLSAHVWPRISQAFPSAVAPARGQGNGSILAAFGKHANRAERKAIGDLVTRNSLGDQLRQTSKFRLASFQTVIVLLEGAEWKARETSLHVGGARITSERDLFEHMI